jgi:hypothetical protein
MQLFIDSKHRLLIENYPVTAVGFLDAAQQFNLVMLDVSNKEDEDFSVLSYRVYKMPSHHVPEPYLFNAQCRITAALSSMHCVSTTLTVLLEIASFIYFKILKRKDRCGTSTFLKRFLLHKIPSLL